jgi:hypothetical protein
MTAASSELEFDFCPEEAGLDGDGNGGADEACARESALVDMTKAPAKAETMRNLKEARNQREGVLREHILQFFYPVPSVKSNEAK